MRSLLAIIVLLCGSVPASALQGTALERGAAITDPSALRELEAGRFGLGRIILPAGSADLPMDNSRLFASPAMLPLRRALDEEFDRYVSRHKAALAHESIGVGTSYDFQLFDRALLYSADTRFVLAGIVNRMDRAYLSQANCGEIRLIYRLTRTIAPGAVDNQASSSASPRLPMTLNVVLKAKSDHAIAGEGEPVTCAEIAKRWLATADLTLTGAALAENLTARGGALELVRPENIERIETNLQIAHAPKSAIRDFRTDYLMKVFDHHAQSETFEEAPLENQIDRERILADIKLQRDFKAWLLDPVHLAEFDRGTILIPSKFLATAAIAPTPVGFASSSLQPAFGLVEGEGAIHAPLFREKDVVTALEKVAASGVKLQNIRSVGGFERRLNDITCSGCHQTRGIGGFHFPGVDWMAVKPSRVVPGSPHFFGDQVRRRDILAAIRDGRPADFSRGFSNRPQSRGSSELAGTEYQDGWGAHCYVARAGAAARNDKSFSSWTCANGLACQPAHRTSQIGMCFVQAAGK